VGCAPNAPAGLEQLNLAGVPARLDLPVVPQRALLEQEVVLGHAHQHAVAGDLGGGLARGVIHKRVHVRVVQPYRLRDHEPPGPVHERPDLGAECHLAAHSLAAVR